MKKVLAMIMAVMMVFTAVPALAEGVMGSITLSNIRIGYGDETVELGLILKTTAGVSEDSFIFSTELANDNGAIADFHAAMAGGDITLGMDGLQNNYAISEADLTEMMQGMASDIDTSAMPTEDIQSLVDAFKQMMDESLALEEQEMTSEEKFAMLEEMGFAKTGEETLLIHGKEFTLPRYEAKLDLAGLDQFIIATYARMPSLKVFMEKYMALLNKIVESTGEEAPISFDVDRPYTSMFESTGVDMNMDVTAWVDETGENVRIEMLVIVEDGTESVQVPYIVEATTDEDGEHVTLNMDMNIEGSTAKMTMSLNDANLEAGERGDFIMDMDVDGQKVTMSGSYDYDENEAGQMNFSTQVPQSETEHVEVAFSVKSTGGDVNTHSVEFTVGSGEVHIITLGFDLTTELLDMSTAAFNDGGKSTLNIKDLTEEDLAKLQEELMTKGVIAYGGLMQTEGVAKLVTEVLTSVQSAVMSEMTEADEPAVYEEEISAATDETAA